MMINEIFHEKHFFNKKRVIFRSYSPFDMFLDTIYININDNELFLPNLYHNKSLIAIKSQKIRQKDLSLNAENLPPDTWRHVTMETGNNRLISIWMLSPVHKDSKNVYFNIPPMNISLVKFSSY